MDRDMSAVNNIHECDKYLSNFGRKVFGVLLEQYRTGQFSKGKNQFTKNNVSRHYISWPRRGGRSNSTISPSNENLINSSHDLSTTLSETENTLTIPTVELFKGPEDIDMTFINTDMVHNSSEAANSQPVFSLNRCDENQHHFALHVSENIETFEATKQVAWEDMVDCKFLNTGICTNIEKAEIVNENDIPRKENDFFCKKIPKKNENNCITDSEAILVDKLNTTDIKNVNIQEANNVNIVVKDNKVIKHKKPVTKRGAKCRKGSDSPDTTIVIQQKVTKVIEKKLKPEFLKRKNKKAINNWLNDVDPSHLVDGIDIQGEDTITSALNEKPDDILQTSLEIVEFRNKPTKMVQTQLMNKNGAMKFTNPNNIKDFSISLDGGNSTPIEVEKIKIRKSKFVAPVKSQNL